MFYLVACVGTTVTVACSRVYHCAYLVHNCTAGFIDVRAVPALKSPAEGGSRELALWLVPMWLLVVAFCITVVVEARRIVYHYDGSNWIGVSAQPLVAGCLMAVSCM